MMDRALTLTVLAAIPAALLAAVSLYQAIKLMVNAEMFLDVVVRMLNEGNRERAVRLSTVLDVPVVQLTRQALALRLPRFEPGQPAGDYRDAAPSDLEARARVVLEEQAQVQLRRMRPGLLVTPIALLSPLVLLAGDLGDATGWVLLASAVAVAGALSNVHRYRRVARELRSVVERLSPWVLAA